MTPRSQDPNRHVHFLLAAMYFKEPAKWDWRNSRNGTNPWRDGAIRTPPFDSNSRYEFRSKETGTIFGDSDE